jgi:hypothetical protein
MRLFRYACAGLATSVLAASAFTGPAAAQAAGVGTSSTSTKLLSAQLGKDGSLLDLSLLTDEARSTIDSAVASPEAFTRLTALAAKAAIVPSSPINVTQGVFEAKSSGPSEVPIAGSVVAVPSAVPAVLAPVLSGTIDPGKLTATLDQGVAASTMNASVSNLKAVGGLVGVDTLKSVLDASSGASTSSATRGASVAGVNVLDLGALLSGLGLPLGELTPDQLVALVDALGAQTGLPLPSGSATLASAVASLNSAVDDLQDAIAQTPTATVTSVVDSTTATLVGTVGGILGTPIVLPTDSTTVVNTVVATLQAAIDQLQTLLTDLLSKGLSALDNLTLLRLEGVDVGVTTKAVETVDGSVAAVTGKIGKVLVGGIELPGIDLTATTDQVNAALAAVNTKLGSVLSIVSPDLANLVKVSVLDKATSITQEGGYTKSRAGITAATATITPPADLAALVSGLVANTSDVTAVLGAAVPQLDGLMGQLGSTLGVGTAALSSPAKVQIASVLSASDFRVGSSTTTGAPGTGTPNLPRTGGNPDLVLFGGLLAVLALALRRFTRTPELQAVEVKH